MSAMYHNLVKEKGAHLDKSLDLVQAGLNSQLSYFEARSKVAGSTPTASKDPSKFRSHHCLGNSTVSSGSTAQQRETAHLVAELHKRFGP